MILLEVDSYYTSLQKPETFTLTISSVSVISMITSAIIRSPGITAHSVNIAVVCFCRTLLDI